MRLVDVARALLHRRRASDQPTAASTSPQPDITRPAQGAKEAEPVTFFAGSDASCAAVGSAPGDEWPGTATDADARDLALSLAAAVCYGAPRSVDLLHEVCAEPRAVVQLVHLVLLLLGEAADGIEDPAAMHDALRRLSTAVQLRRYGP